MNSKTDDFTPMVTPDETSLFLTSLREGASDLFWVDAEVIARMRPARER